MDMKAGHPRRGGGAVEGNEFLFGRAKLMSTSTAGR